MDHSAMSDYMAHGFCFSWEPGLVWTYVGLDHQVKPPEQGAEEAI